MARRGKADRATDIDVLDLWVSFETACCAQSLRSRSRSGLKKPASWARHGEKLLATKPSSFCGGAKLDCFAQEGSQ